MKNTIIYASVLSFALCAGCDESAYEPAPEQQEALTDLELPTPEALIDPNAPEPDDEGPVDQTPVDQTPVPSIGELTSGGHVDSPNPSNVVDTISPGTVCIGNWQCPFGERCDSVPVNGYSLSQCVGPCGTDADCEQGEECGNDGFCDVLVRGDWDFCVNGGCGRGHGDCDPGDSCGGGTTCMNDAGAPWGYASGVDVCDYPAGHARYCSAAHPCVGGQGDCDNNAQCTFGTVCKEDRGPQFGFASWVDVCLLPWQ